MRTAQEGDTVRVHYTGTLDDGTVFDTSANREPLEFQIGKQQVIKGFEDAVVGLEEGGTTVAKLSAHEAYGPRREELVMRLGREQVPENIDPQVGQRLILRRQDGAGIQAVITEVSEEAVTLDANHPLAGEQLTFTIQLVEVV